MLRSWQYRDGMEPESVELAAVVLSDDTLLWVEASDVTEDDLSAIAQHLHVADLAMEDLAKGRQRTKLVAYPDHWHVALHDHELHGSDLVSHEIDIVLGDRWILTLHHRADNALFAEMRQRYERQHDEHGTIDEGFALWAVLDVIVDRWFIVSDRVDEELECIEDVVFSDGSDGIPQGVFALRRALVTFRRSVSPTREVLAALLRRDVEEIGEAALMHLRDVNDHVMRVLDLLESQRELVTGLLEAQLSIASNRMNQVMKATSSWGAILVFNTLIAGIYGMNFRHLPELGWYFGYPFALGMMALTTWIGYIIFKRRGWL